MSDAPILEVAGLCTYYGTSQALFDATLAAPRTGAVAVLGLNGAGKTTMIEILEGMRDADSGEAIINVKADPRAVKAMIGVQLQRNAFFDNLKLAEIVGL